MSHDVILTQNDSSKKYMSNIGYFIATEDKSMNKQTNIPAFVEQRENNKHNK